MIVVNRDYTATGRESWTQRLKTAGMMRGGEWEVISSGLVEDSPPLCFFCRQNYSLKLQIGWENSGHLRKLKCHRRWHYASGMLLLLSSSTWCCHIVLTFQLFQPHDSVSFSSLYLCGLYGRKCAMFVPSRGQMGDLDRSIALMQAVCNNCRADLLLQTLAFVLHTQKSSVWHKSEMLPCFCRHL